MSHANVQHTLTANNADLDSKLAQARKSIGSYGAHVTKTMKAAALGFGAIAAAAAGGAAYTLRLFAKQEDAERKLEAVLKATGGAAGWTSEQLKAMAGDMQKVTIYGDETTLAAMGVMATFKEIRGDQFKEAMEAAMDMSAVMGTDLQGSIVQLGKALNDPIKGVSALADVGVSFTQEQRDQIKTMIEAGDIMGAQGVILAELKGEFGGTAVAMAETFGGRITQLKNKLGDLGEQIGGALAPALGDLIGWVSGLVDMVGANQAGIQSWITGFVDLTKTITSYVVPVFQGLLKFYAGYWAVMETAVTNYRDVFSYAMTAVAYQAVKAFNIIGHWLTRVLPDFLMWFMRNWREIFTDLWNFTRTVFTNMLTNVKGFFTAIWSYLQGDGFSFEWTGLTDGFKATLQELPTIAARIPGELEKELGGKLGKLGDTIGGAFQSNYQKRLAMLGLVEGPEAPGGAAPAGAASYGGPADQSGRSYAVAKAKEKKDAGKSGTGFEGLDALYKRIAGAAANKAEDRTASATEKSAKELEAIRKSTQNQEQLLKNPAPAVLVR